jgi:O-antigen/teichoic acid export membrane protein
MRASSLTKALKGNFIGEVAIRLPQLVFDGLAARILSPKEFGALTGLRILLQMTPYLPSIATSGLDLRYSRLVGAGDSKGARQAAGTAWVIVICATAVQLSLLTIGLSSSGLRTLLAPGVTRNEYAIFLFAVLIQGPYVFLVSHLRNQLKFAAVNAALLIGNVTALLVLVVALPRLRPAAAVLALTVNMFLAVVLWSRRFDIEMPTRSIFLSEGSRLLLLGSPLLVIGFAFDSVRLLTRWVVGQRFGSEELGFLGVAYMISGVVYLVGTSASRVMIQFMARAHGERVTQAQQLHQLFHAPALGVLSLSAIATVGISVTCQALLPLWAPAQVGALPLLRPTLYSAMLLTMSFLYMTLLRAQQRFRVLALSTTAAFLILGALLGIVHFLGLSLYWYALSEVASFGLLLAFLSVFTQRGIATDQLPFTLTVFVVVAMTALGLEFGEYVAGSTGENPLGKLSIELLVSSSAALVWVPLVLRMRRGLNLAVPFESARPDGVAGIKDSHV